MGGQHTECQLVLPFNGFNTSCLHVLKLSPCITSGLIEYVESLIISSGCLEFEAESLGRTEPNLEESIYCHSYINAKKILHPQPHSIAPFSCSIHKWHPKSFDGSVLFARFS